MQTAPKVPNKPADSTQQAPLPGTTLVGFDTFKKVAQELADKTTESIAICRRPSDAPGASSVPYANRPLREFNRDAQGMELIEVIHPSQARLVAKVRQAVSGLPKDKSDALKEHFGLDGGPPIQPVAATENFLAALRDASDNPGGDALAQWLSRKPPPNESDQVTEALRDLRRPQSGK